LTANRPESQIAEAGGWAFLSKNADKETLSHISSGIWSQWHGDCLPKGVESHGRDSPGCGNSGHAGEILRRIWIMPEPEAFSRKRTARDSSLLEPEKPDAGETGLLLQAFEMFTQASSSLESAFSQLQARVQRLTEELEAKNIELEKSLREKEEAQSYLRTILERLPCGVFVLDDKGNLNLCNPMASEVLGVSGHNAIATHDQTFLGSEMLEYLIEKGFDDKCNEEIEVPVVSGDKNRTLATSWAALTNAAGSPLGTLHIIRDITEVKALQEQGKRIERLSAMGEMAVELAHEIRNPLGSIELFSSLLVKDLTGDLKRWAENIRVGIRSLNAVVSNMLHFANPISPAFSSVDIHEIIKEIVRFSDPIMNQREVHVETNLSASNSVIDADSELLKQMMLNLMFNAMKAMPSKGSLKISTRNLPPTSDARPSAGLELRIEDTGVGIPKENLDRIFDPFFTTNKNGTGLGLSVVHQIVELHSGHIRVSSEINRGTTFTIVFGSEPEKE
jgi:PAS domain S-box-containing protein